MAFTTKMPTTAGPSRNTSSLENGINMAMSSDEFLDLILGTNKIKYNKQLQEGTANYLTDINKSKEGIDPAYEKYQSRMANANMRKIYQDMGIMNAKGKLLTPNLDLSGAPVVKYDDWLAQRNAIQYQQAQFNKPISNIDYSTEVDPNKFMNNAYLQQLDNLYKSQINRKTSDTEKQLAREQNVSNQDRAMAIAAANRRLNLGQLTGQDVGNVGDVAAVDLGARRQASDALAQKEQQLSSELNDTRFALQQNQLEQQKSEYDRATQQAIQDNQMKYQRAREKYSQEYTEALNDYTAKTAENKFIYGNKVDDWKDSLLMAQSKYKDYIDKAGLEYSDVLNAFRDKINAGANLSQSEQQEAQLAFDGFLKKEGEKLGLTSDYLTKLSNLVANSPEGLVQQMIKSVLPILGSAIGAYVGLPTGVGSTATTKATTVKQTPTAIKQTPSTSFSSISPQNNTIKTTLNTPSSYGQYL